MPRLKILLTVTTYPLPSRSYDELVCTAGVQEDGSWIRIYPVPLSFLRGLKRSGEVQRTKYTWIEFNLKKRTDDFRPESYSPQDYEFKDLKVGDRIPPKDNWSLRKDYCLKNIYTNLTTLIEDSKAPKNISLATFKPRRVIGLDIVEDEEDWKAVWKGLQQQMSLFGEEEEAKRKFPKVPFKFYYRFEDETGRASRLMIEDWEIGQLYWNCLRDAQGDQQIPLEKVRHKYETDFLNDKDLYFFLGTTLTWHRRRGSNPFVIIGVFYPKRETQLRLRSKKYTLHF
jgi:hypothetical protein